MKKTLILIAILFLSNTQAQQLAVLKYNGGGDWYSNPTAVPNLITYCNDHIGTQLNKEVAFVEPSSVSIFQYPFIHMTGHGNVVCRDGGVRAPNLGLGRSGAPRQQGQGPKGPRPEG